MPIPWPCCGSSACSTCRGSCSRRPKRSRSPEARRSKEQSYNAPRGLPTDSTGTAFQSDDQWIKANPYRESKEHVMRKSRLFATLILGGVLGTGLIACEEKGPAERA